MAFNILPVEINTIIACYLNDSDLITFTKICHATYSAVNHQNSSVWRIRFQQDFDLQPNTRNDRLKELYQYRKRVLRHGARFTHGRSSKEARCLKVLVEIAIEAYADRAGKVDDIKSKNIRVLEKFAKESDLLQMVLAPKYQDKLNPLLLTVQVLLMHVQLDLSFAVHTYSFPASQRAAYASSIQKPIFKGPNGVEVNLDFVAGTLNFFKYHLTREEEHTLYSDFKDLPATERVRPWRRKLSNNHRMLGRNWKGVYSYLELPDLQALREAEEDDEQVMVDNFNTEDPEHTFQTLELDFPKKSYPWPTGFERHLKSLNHPCVAYLSQNPTPTPSTFKPSPSKMLGTRRTRAQLRNNPSIPVPAPSPTPSVPINPKPVSFQFLGLGSDADPFLATGWLNPLPSQQNIPGWQRWTMMKFFTDLESADISDSQGQAGAEVDGLHNTVAQAAMGAASSDGDLWAYEGVVLPGGEVVVGRWWHPREVDADADADDGAIEYSGPFMFWCVDL